LGPESIRKGLREMANYSPSYLRNGRAGSARSRATFKLKKNTHTHTHKPKFENI